MTVAGDDGHAHGTPVKILHVVGARPNFMKIAPIIAALREHAGVRQILVHTGQHYDAKMSDIFFRDLGMPDPDVHLGVGSGTHAQQTAKVMVEIEPVLTRERPDMTVVAGDVNSTVAVALVAAKLGLKIAHVEAGLRSNDWTMPEEINRVVTDRLSDLLFTPSRDGDENLKREGIPAERIRFVGNVMIDSLQTALPRARESDIHQRLEVEKRGYALATLHRPSNVDEPAALQRLLSALGDIGAQLPVVFPIHPRTRARLPAGYEGRGLKPIEPLGYLDFLALIADARLVMTDSGGIQEETTALGVPCLTLRENTERPVTITDGTNQLVGTDPARVVPAAREILAGRGKAGRIPELWDGRAAERVAEELVRYTQGG
ncbi:MAG TPA: UDP-N-acetylglucosamine 2-epimerase (non-hydrolyzing) [Myxococcales bacterium]|nr:UDP-N-acetylglucosamine 2-epimerase (non-hydrolyzing) [Myxococcales bacterium]